MRARLRASRGFCSRHAWQCRQVERAIWDDGLSTAAVSESLLNDLLARIEDSLAGAEPAEGPRGVVARLRQSPRDAAPGDLEKRLVATGACPACVSDAHVVGTACWTVADALARGGDRTTSAYTGAAPFPVEHFLTALGQARTPVRALLVRTQLDKMRRLARERAESIRRHDYRFQGESKGEEQTSWLRAVELFAGSLPGPAALEPPRPARTS